MTAPLAERVYARLLPLYPKAFRDEYGDDMLLLFREQCRQESTWLVSVHALVDLAVSVPAQHVEARMQREPHPVVALVYLCVAVAGVGVAAFGGSSLAGALVGLGIAAVAGVLSIVAWHRRARKPHTHSSVSAAWWKFTISAPVLAGGVILGAGLGIEAWFLGLAVVLTAAVLLAVGVVLGLVHLFSRSRVAST